VSKAVEYAYRLVTRPGPIDALTLLRAVSHPDLLKTDEVRMQLLVRDSLRGLERHWGSSVLRRRLDTVGVNPSQLRFDDLADEKGFTVLGERIVDATDPETLFQLLRDLGRRVHRDTALTIGGSLSLMLDAYVVRKTDGIDLVNEIPSPIRSEHALLAELTEKYQKDGKGAFDPLESSGGSPRSG
jgi:hypothetical protein